MNRPCGDAHHGHVCVLVHSAIDMAHAPHKIVHECGAWKWSVDGNCSWPSVATDPENAAFAVRGKCECAESAHHRDLLYSLGAP